MASHLHEAERLESLRSYRILGTHPEPEFDAIASLAASVTRSPIASIVFVDEDEHWCKSMVGLDVSSTHRPESLCSHVVTTGEPLTVGNAARDMRFCDLEVVGEPWQLCAYAGVPLVGRDGLPIGTLCVLDRRPRRYTRHQLGMLDRLAAQVMSILELRRGDAARGLSWETMLDDLADPARIWTALDEGELVPYYQPIVDLTTGRVHGLEALLRWEHPVYGTVGPARFLPAIETSGLMMPVGRHVLHESVALFGRLRDSRRDMHDVTMSVNVSLTQLQDSGLAEVVFRELETGDLPPRALTLELTESADLLDDRAAVAELRALHEAGVGISLDDFGTGYSSLLRVLDLPVGTLKLDRSIVGRLPGDRRAAHVLESTVAMAHGLGLTVVAEGVESHPQRETLIEIGCELGQGYLFSTPQPPDVIEEVLVHRGMLPLLDEQRPAVVPMRRVAPQRRSGS